jgi:hypothetical protein
LRELPRNVAIRGYHAYYKVIAVAFTQKGFWLCNPLQYEEVAICLANVRIPSIAELRELLCNVAIRGYHAYYKVIAVAFTQKGFWLWDPPQYEEVAICLANVRIPSIAELRKLLCNVAIRGYHAYYKVIAFVLAQKGECL